MSKIADAFQNKKAFIPFVTAGDPTLDVTKEILFAMQEAGADLIEIGIPFSDPVAEGPVIQEADDRALASGTTTDKIFELLNGIKEQIHIPMVFMTYFNPIYAYGVEKFVKNAKECGICGMIVPDLPFEEREEIRGILNANRLELISMIAPTSAERVKMIAKEAQGFVYCVSSLGVTGVRTKISTGISALIKQVKEVTDIPCAIGFGISTPEQATEMAKISDGAIVGSAIVKIVARHGEDSASYVRDYVKEMKQAVCRA